MTKQKKIFCELALFCKRFFKARDYFVCVYGSFASSDCTENSDIDILIATAEHHPVDFKKARDFVINLHLKNKQKIDEEVPYKNKLIVSYDDINEALKLKAFTKKGLRYFIPPITSDKKFLASHAVRLRIILNALTSPHSFICGNIRKYKTTKNKAEKAILELVRGLTNKKSLDQEEVLGLLLRGLKGEKSGAYLGYRDQRIRVIQYLKNLISRHYDH